MRISDWSSDVCSSDLFVEGVEGQSRFPLPGPATMPLDTDASRLIDHDFGHAIVIEILPQRPNIMIEDRRIAERRVPLRPSPYTAETSKSLARADIVIASCRESVGTYVATSVVGGA